MIGASCIPALLLATACETTVKTTSPIETHIETEAELPALTQAADTADVLIGKEFLNALGAKATGTMSNHGTWDIVDAIPGSGYYSSITSSLTAAEVCSTATFLGSPGSANCSEGGDLLLSTAYRDRGTTPITREAEVTTYSGAGATPDLPTTGGYAYRDIMAVEKDDDGFTGTSMSYAPRPTVDCGLSGAIDARITDCNRTWDGTTQGNGGQAIWRLVTRKGANREVWKDMRTGLLWSSLARNNLGNIYTVNGCRGTGNIQRHPLVLNRFAGVGNGTLSGISSGNSASDETITLTATDATTFSVSGSVSGALPAATVGVAYVNIKANFTMNAGSTPFQAGDTFTLWSTSNMYGCHVGGFMQTNPATSFCSEIGGGNPGFFGEDWSAGTYHDSKGGMGANFTDKVRWRSPTMHDYMQAEIDGIRMVMPDMGAAGANRPIQDASQGAPAGVEWTSTVDSNVRSTLFVFVPASGRVTGSTLALNGYVRCVA